MKTINWRAAKNGTDAGLRNAYLYGMGTDLTDDDITIIMRVQFAMSAFACQMAFEYPPTDSYVSDIEWRGIQLEAKP